MASVINTNTLSMVTQQNLNQSQNALNTSMERLSSGMRINSAKDDAAGQAIANRMDSQITGLSQAQRNANDGISVAQTAEGALNQVNDNLQRVRELTVQAANGTNSAEDKQSIQDEINLRLAEIDRISEQTSFNGVDVLNTDASLSIQVGANDGETIEIDLQKTNKSTLGLDGFNVGTPTEVTEFTTTTGNVTTTADLSWNEGTADEATALLDATSLDELKLTTYTDAGGATAYAIEDTDGSMIKVDGTDVTVDESTGIVQFTAGYNQTKLDSGKAAYQVDADGGYTGTVDPLEKLDEAIKQVDGMRSDLGAVQNRFDSAITNLATTETNLASAQSRIQDADYAEEVSSMTTAQILQQAGTSMLTQANQVPQNVLSLLG
ncbi:MULTISPECIES: FliC/FljB family flagellin [Cobetia]|uniref:FliC/FljB family flagellin n=1 Tax=Cobetia TaxID=204286 RepID=UPI0009867D24|nr:MULTISPECIES: FliC/FljB family flagellin [Cobetia]POR06389.1 flagellin [Cobetia sp. MM1IDA2H-1]